LNGFEVFFGIIFHIGIRVKKYISHPPDAKKSAELTLIRGNFGFLNLKPNDTQEIHHYPMMPKEL
jgi:hypothetical protein